MLARLTIAPIPAEKTDEVERVFRDAIGPAPRDVKGFRGGYALTDREAGWPGQHVLQWSARAQDLRSDRRDARYPPRI